MTAAAKPDHDEMLKEARERFQYINDTDRHNREQAKRDTQFVYIPGKQWPDDIRSQREGWKEPTLEFNQLKQFVAQVVNEQRMARPSIRVQPASGRASKEVAEIEQGMIRGIEYHSKAEAAYDNGFQCAVVGGRGYWRIVTEYAEGFDQRIVIKPIPDPLTVYLDPDYQEPDGSDRGYGFVTEAMKKEEFARQYPDADPLSWDQEMALWWDGPEKVIIADYYRRVCTLRTMVQMSDGNHGWKDELPAKLPEGITILKEREAESYRVEWYKIAGGNQVLEVYEWAGKRLPVVCTTGDDIIIDGRRIYQGLIRQARDPQAMLNFGMTQQAIHLALTPRAPWVAAEGQLEGYENIWKNANTQNYSVLPYKPTSIEGLLVPAPQRQMPSMPDAGWIQWTQSMTGMIRSTVGMYEASLGMRGDVKSGVALREQQTQGDRATFHYVDNLSRAIALTGLLILELIPKTYDTARIVHIVAPDDTEKMVAINQAGAVDGMGNALKAVSLGDIQEGDYAVVVEAGPGYATRRQETSDKLLALVEKFPPVAQVAGDLVVKALDIADADLIAERMRFTLPPEIQATIAKQEGEKPIPPAALAQMQELAQQRDKALGLLQQAQEREDAMREEAAKIDTAKVQLKAQADGLKAEGESLALKEQLALSRIELEEVKLESATAKAELQVKETVANEFGARLEQTQGATLEEARQIAETVRNELASAHLDAVRSEVLGALQETLRLVTAPRVTKLITDESGEPVGAVSEIEAGAA